MNYSDITIHYKINHILISTSKYKSQNSIIYNNINLKTSFKSEFELHNIEITNIPNIAQYALCISYIK